MTNFQKEKNTGIIIEIIAEIPKLNDYDQNE